jgi:hypothetical protein
MYIVCYTYYMSKFQSEFHVSAKDGWAEATWLDDPFVVTALLEQNEHGVSADFWISGRTWRGNMALVMRLQLGLEGIRNLGDAEAHCHEFWDTSLRGWAFGSALVEGVPNLQSQVDLQTRTFIAQTHLWAHERMGSFNDPIDRREMRRAALMYQLVTGFGLKTPMKLIQELEQVPMTTVSQRLTMARNSGMLQKRREATSQSKERGKETTGRS